jgi:hypothetical protein
MTTKFTAIEFSFIYMITLTCLLALPITEITFGIGFRNEVNCESLVTIPLWLILQGSVKTVSTIAGLSYFLMDVKSLCAYFLFFIHIVCNMFLLGWVILGSIIFWRDCPNLEPKNVNTLMWFSLILEIIFLLGSQKSMERKKK